MSVPSTISRLVNDLIRTKQEYIEAKIKIQLYVYNLGPREAADLGWHIEIEPNGNQYFRNKDGSRRHLVWDEVEFLQLLRSTVSGGN